MGKIKYKNYELIKDFLLVTLGGFIGAVFGLLSQNQMIGRNAGFLIGYYAGMILVIILVLRFFSEER